MNHDLADAYLKRLRSFESSNPAAHAFLKRVEQEGPSHGLWLSGGSGVHVYKRTAFLGHVHLSLSKAKPFSLVFAKHEAIWAQARDMSHLLLPHPLVRLVMASSGFRRGWSAAGPRTVELKASTPDDFYQLLFSMLSTLEIENETPGVASSLDGADTISVH